MCCYKLVTCKFIWWGLQGRVASLIQKVTRWPPLCIVYVYDIVDQPVHINVIVYNVISDDKSVGLKFGKFSKLCYFCQTLVAKSQSHHRY